MKENTMMDKFEYKKFQKVILKVGEILLLVRTKQILGFYPYGDFVTESLKKDDLTVEIWI